MADQRPLYSTLDAMIAEDAKKKALQNNPRGGPASIPDQVVLGGATGNDDEGVSLLSMPTALQQLGYHTTHDQRMYGGYQPSGESSEGAHLINRQPTGESSQAIEIKLKGGTTDDGTITAPISPKRTDGTPSQQPLDFPSLEIFQTSNSSTADAETYKKGHARHPSNNYFDDGDTAPMFPNRTQPLPLSFGGRPPQGNPTTTPNQQFGMEPYIPPPSSQPPTNTNVPKPYIHTTYIRDPATFAENDRPLSPIDDLRIPLGLSSAPPSPLENNHSPQNTGMGLNYSNGNNSRQNSDSNTAWRRYIVIVIAVLAVGAIAFAVVILVQGAGKDASPSRSPGIDFIPPERTPSPTTPTTSPSLTPTEIIVYDPPTEQDCQAVLSGRAVPGQVNMIERLYEIPFDIVINEGTELIGFLNQFMQGMRTIVIPELTRCDGRIQRTLMRHRELRDISNVVANAIATGEYSDEPCSRVQEGVFCQRIVVNFVLYLRGDERNLDIAVLIRNAIAGTDGSSGDSSLLSRFGLDGKAASLQATQVINLNPTQSPSSSPTNVPSVKPSFRPSNIPSMVPSIFPSVSPTTSMPSKRPSQSPSMVPSSQPSCSETSSWFDTQITSTPLLSGGLVTYSLNCADREDGIAVLIWDGVDKCTTQCLGYLNQGTADNTCVTSSQFIVSFNIPPALDTDSLNFLVGTMDSITAGSLSLSCPGSILASVSPTSIPSAGPTNVPSIEPSNLPSKVPSTFPSMVPSTVPSEGPSMVPSTSPSRRPTNAPSESPSMRPSKSPSISPTAFPTLKASRSPTSLPSRSPSARPSLKASSAPSKMPSIRPTLQASSPPSKAPVPLPTVAPVTKAPAAGATKSPTTAAPVSKAPTTSAPVSKAPTTSAPVSKAPTTSTPSSSSSPSVSKSPTIASP